MDTNKIEKYLKIYIKDIIEPRMNRQLTSGDDEPIKISVYKVNLGENNPNRLNYFLDIDPIWKKDTVEHRVNPDLSRFTQMLGVQKNLHIYWNKRPLS